MRITFLLPLAGTHPIGGFKVVYEYANYLAGRGHGVSVVHPAIYRIDEPLQKLRPKAAMGTIWRYARSRLSGGFKPTAWFKVAPEVRLLWVPSLSERYVPDGDAVVATAWETAEWAATYGPAKGRRFYLIQHLETWSGSDERVLATWRAPFEKIVIAKWLQRTAEEQGESAHLIYNGLDFERFRMVTPPEDRDPRSLLMIFHRLEWKGSVDGLRAFELARKQEPELKLTLFGVVPQPDDLPAGVKYHENPSQATIVELYNRAAIFISASWTEGFSLPPAEALQCGAAIVLTDIEGPASYAFDEETALLSRVRDPAAMAGNIVRLVRDPVLRVKMARRGHEVVREFTWERAGSALEKVLAGGSGGLE